MSRFLRDLIKSRVPITIRQQGSTMPKSDSQAPPGTEIKIDPTYHPAHRNPQPAYPAQTPFAPSPDPNARPGQAPTYRPTK